jgi:hypothetical protein
MQDQQGHRITVRAFRGRRRTSVYRECSLSDERFERIRAAADELGLLTLVTLPRHGEKRLDKARAHRLATELGLLRADGRLLDLDDDLVVLASVVAWCGHAPSNAWLTVIG